MGENIYNLTLIMENIVPFFDDQNNCQLGLAYSDDNEYHEIVLRAYSLETEEMCEGLTCVTTPLGNTGVSWKISLLSKSGKMRIHSLSPINL